MKRISDCKMQIANCGSGCHSPEPRSRAISRRDMFGQMATGLGAVALGTLLGSDAQAAQENHGDLPELPHFAAKAKRVIFLFQSGAPSQLDLFDHKPQLANLRATELPDSIRQGQRLTGMTSRQASFPIAPSRFKFAQHGASGAWLSELLPHT